MNTTFPIVKIDRTTAQEWLPMLMNRGIFTRYNKLPSKEDILSKAKDELGVESLTPAQEREVLASAGEYKTNRFVVKDYGQYAIGFDAKMYIDFLNETEENIENELLRDKYEKSRIHEALRQVRLYKLGHKLSVIILAEAYRQRKFEELTISKETILGYLDFQSEENHIYKDIDEAMFSLRWLNYILFEYKTKSKLGKKAKTTGNFIYNLRQDSKSYTVWINKVFLGCIVHVLSEETRKVDDSNKKSLFSRGYFNYPTEMLKVTKNYSTPAYLLANFLILDSGNSKLNTESFKVVAYKLWRFVEKSGIHHSRPGYRKQVFLKAIQEVDFIEKLDPGFDELSKIKPAGFEDQLLHIYIKRDPKSSLLRAKTAKK